MLLFPLAQGLKLPEKILPVTLNQLFFIYLFNLLRFCLKQNVSLSLLKAINDVAFTMTRSKTVFSIKLNVKVSVIFEKIADFLEM